MKVVASDVRGEIGVDCLVRLVDRFLRLNPIFSRTRLRVAKKYAEQDDSSAEPYEVERNAILPALRTRRGGDSPGRL